MKPLSEWTLKEVKRYCEGANCKGCAFNLAGCLFVNSAPSFWELPDDEEHPASDTLPVQLDPGAFMPERAHELDAGLDIRSPVERVIAPYNSETVHTGVHVQLPPGTVGMLKSKSGLNIKHGITSEGVIDEGYTGEIVVKVYNHGYDAFRIKRGDKISQLVVLPVLRPTPVQVDKIEGGERGDNGFGSTGR